MSMNEATPVPTNTGAGDKKKRVHKSPETRKAEILAVATQVFAERGYQVADTQTIADMAGVGKGTLYRYFPTKETLFKNALSSQLDKLQKRMTKARESSANPLCALRNAMGEYFLFFDQNPEIIELFVQERAEFGVENTPLYFQRMRARDPEWVALFEAIRDQCPVRDMPIDAMMARGSEVMHGASYLNCAPHRSRSAYEQLDEIFEFYLHGILQVENPLRLLVS